MKEEKTAVPKVRRQVLWVSGNGRWVVVEGPFPHGFPRTIDANTIGLASKRGVDTIVARQGTTKPGRYAKTRAAYVEKEANEWGEIGL
jgi:hypothetical protein